MQLHGTCTITLSVETVFTVYLFARFTALIAVIFYCKI